MRKAVLIILICLFLLAGCAPADGITPPSTGDGWQTASPASVGLDGAKLDDMAAAITAGEYENVHGIVIIKNSKLVFEQYFPGHMWAFEGDQFHGDPIDYDADTLHNLASVTKSFTSALIGIAVDRGHIAGVNETLFSYFPEYAHLETAGKDEITLERLLTMTSGLQWNGMEIFVGSRDSRNDLIQLFRVDDPIEYILAKPLVSEPGVEWYYHGGGTNLLGEVIRKAAGVRMDDFAAAHLFAPLGITDYEWDFINAEMIHASGNLRLRPRDMAKFGYLYLNGGVWQGERVLSEAWIDASVKDHATTRGGEGYGYQWWLRSCRVGSTTFDSYYAAGWGGQRIMVFPAQEMVVVLTGGNYVQNEPTDELIARYILPAVEP